jgi:hypothetical protein
VTGPSLRLLYFQPLGISGSLRESLGVVHCKSGVAKSFLNIVMAFSSRKKLLLIDAMSRKAAALVKIDESEKATLKGPS